MGDDASEGIGRRLLEREATEPAAAAVDTRRHASGPGAGWSYGVKCVLTRVAGGWDNGISVDIFKNLIMVEWRTNAQLTVGCTCRSRNRTILFFVYFCTSVYAAPPRRGTPAYRHPTFSTSPRALALRPSARPPWNTQYLQVTNVHLRSHLTSSSDRRLNPS